MSCCSSRTWLCIAVCKKGHPTFPVANLAPLQTVRMDHTQSTMQPLEFFNIVGQGDKPKPRREGQNLWAAIGVTVRITGNCGRGN